MNIRSLSYNDPYELESLFKRAYFKTIKFVPSCICFNFTVIICSNLQSFRA